MNTSKRYAYLACGAIGFVLLLPALLFVSASVLKYELGVAFLYDNLGFLSNPQSLPLYNTISPAVFLGGPLLAAALNIEAIMRLTTHKDSDSIVCTINVKAKLLNIAIAATSSLLLVTLIGYLIVENLGHL